MTADYNGWNDLRESEREALEEAEKHYQDSEEVERHREHSVYHEEVGAL